LDAWEIPYFPLESPDDLSAIEAAWRRSVASLGPSVVLIGAATEV
jgi:hypothetical protein